MGAERQTERKNYFGVTYNLRDSRWYAFRCSKNEKKSFSHGHFKDEETAAHASDTLARKLIANGEKGHQLNFPDDGTEVYPNKSSDFIGVTYSKKDRVWRAGRRSKDEHKNLYNGSYKNEETAAHASDTLAIILIANGESHKLNFPDDETDVYPEKATYQEKKRKRPESLGNSQRNRSYQDEI